MVDLDAVYREHSASVYRFLLARTGSSQLAEELTQETFYQAVRSIDRFDGSCQITTFLFGITKNVWRNACRKGKKARMGREEILSAVHRMPEPGREVLYLRLLGSLSFAEIGAILGRTENWARVTYYRTKQQLIKEMKQA